MPADMRELVADLSAETTEVTALVSGLDEEGWRTPTPAPGWNVGDQVSHLAFFDDAAVRSATDPEGFTEELGAAFLGGELSTDDIARRHRKQTGPDLLAWFAASRRTLIGVFGDLDPVTRLPWFGPSMSAASAITARIMETWAHGQDIADGLGITRTPTARLRHVAYLGVRALPYSYLANGRPVPPEPVRVELVLPDGEPVAWGPSDAENVVTGTALDFSLAATRRRHRADTALTARGQVADGWLDIVQAFAGPPGEGRPPGKHGNSPS
jgi:uncharacterized protein (TIGR03084 family)